MVTGAVKNLGRTLCQSARAVQRLSILADYLAVKRKYAFLRKGGHSGHASKTVLVVSLSDWITQVKMEALLAKALQQHGWRPVIVTRRNSRWAHRYYRLLGLEDLIYFDEWLKAVPESVDSEAQTLLDSPLSFAFLLDHRYRDAYVGRHVLSVVARNLRNGSVSFDDPAVRAMIRQQLTYAYRSVRASEMLLQHVKPSSAIFLEKGGTGVGEIFDIALNNGVDAIQFVHSHRTDALVFKRYTPETRHLHPFSLSDDSWKMVSARPWDEQIERELTEELENRYRDGTWFNRKFVQMGKSLKSPEKVRAQLGLDPSKKTAVVFSHVLWDATFFFGKNLFQDYEEWLVETVKAACKNSAVNWVIKVHPDYVWKLKQLGTGEKPQDLEVLRNRVGALPPHIKVLEPDTDISTLSVFAITDYGITVRGTVGIELSCLGVPVFTAGTGRYSGMGFTDDSVSREEYLHKLAHIQDWPSRLSRGKTELAKRYAHAILKLRPLIFRSFEQVQMPFHKLGHPLDHNVAIRLQSFEEFRRAADLRAFADWASDRRQLDFLVSAPGVAKSPPEESGEKLAHEMQPVMDEERLDVASRRRRRVGIGGLSGGAFLRARAASVLRQAGVLPVAWTVWRWVKMVFNPAFSRREQLLRSDYREFKELYGYALGCKLRQGNRSRQKALVVSVGFISGVKAELGLIKGLEAAGFNVTAVMKRDPWLAKYYRLTGVADVLFWDQFTRHLASAEVETTLSSLPSLEYLLSFEYAGTRTGRCAASTALRNLRAGSLDLQSPVMRRAVCPYIVSGMVHALAARDLIRRVRPQVAMFVDRGYTPQGELFDVCLAEGVDVFTWNAAHRGNSLMLKRYRRENRDEHPASLSDESWSRVRAMPWTDAHSRHLREELFSAYASGDWYSEVGTQFKTRMLQAQEIRNRLRLDGSKKTAVISPHILWDGTFFWGTDLFRNYEEWFLETTRAAIGNRNLNWVIKVHPANIVKDARDGVGGEPSELIALRNHIGTLPDHIRIIAADSDISTFSLFSVMDYCLTVRGTIGIEAACMGIPVLTAGTGRYDHKGFTIDSESREEYLKRLAGLQDIPPLRASQQELAERFAYAVFVMRTLLLTSFTLEYRKDATASIQTQIKAVGPEDWLAAPDLKAFVEWLTHPDQLDFFSTLPNAVGDYAAAVSLETPAR
ncbi:MAG: hypothetical protein FJ245_13965 [Nitrospira sp.]|nr:hypothetical protein [Nitrospira sp.]